MNKETGVYDLSPALLRQRRNLFVVSILTIFLVSAGATLNAITVLGVEITFKNPEAIIYFLKIALLYFVYRYYVYLLQEPDLYLKKTFYQKLTEYTWLKIKSIKDSKYPDVTEYGGEYDFRKMVKTGYLKRKVKAVVSKDSAGGTVEDYFEIDIFPLWWDALRALIYTLSMRSYFTDYMLPFAIAFAALILGWKLDN